MLDDKGFDLWSSDYDNCVKQDDEGNRYPFAGYNFILRMIYDEVQKKPGSSVLDIGFGTGVLTSKLYEEGHTIDGIDFSEKMLACAQQKMPDANLVLWDFGKGLPPSFADKKFDFIVTTYALHHLTNDGKRRLIDEMLNHLSEEGEILIGDIAFETKAALEACRKSCGDGFDRDEIYMTMDEMLPLLQKEYSAAYRQVSACAGILKIRK